MALAVSALKYNYVLIQIADSGKKSIDLTNHLLHTEYFEDLLSPIIDITKPSNVAKKIDIESPLEKLKSQVMIFSDTNPLNWLINSYNIFLC